MKENILLDPGEEIVHVQGYEDLYSITSFGRVWSHERKVRCNLGVKIVKAKFLKPRLNKYGYLQVNLSKDNKKRTYKIHRLVAIHYLLNPYDLPEVNHKDGIKSNCRKDNLEWCTSQKNHSHASKNGLKYKYYSKYYGVTLHKGLIHKNKPWEAYTTFNKKRKYIGSFKTELEAAKAYNEFVIKNNLNRPLNRI